MERWKEGQIQKPRLPPDPIVSATARLQRDLSSVMVNEYLSEAENPQLNDQSLHKVKTAHQKEVGAPLNRFKLSFMQTKYLCVLIHF